MQIIKNKKLEIDNWTFIPETENLNPTGDVTVSLTRWQQDKAQLLNHHGKCGIRLKPSDSLDDIINDLNHIELVELDFPELADGRLFSLAWLLRGRYNYQGEIRAIGHYLPEQVFYLSRVGVNAFAPSREEDIQAILSDLNDFSVTYQASIN